MGMSEVRLFFVPMYKVYSTFLQQMVVLDKNLQLLFIISAGRTPPSFLTITEGLGVQAAVF